MTAWSLKVISVTAEPCLRRAPFALRLFARFTRQNWHYFVRTDVSSVVQLVSYFITTLLYKYIRRSIKFTATIIEVIKIGTSCNCRFSFFYSVFSSTYYYHQRVRSSLCQIKSILVISLNRVKPSPMPVAFHSHNHKTALVLIYYTVYF